MAPNQPPLSDEEESLIPELSHISWVYLGEQQNATQTLGEFTIDLRDEYDYRSTVIDAILDYLLDMYWVRVWEEPRYDGIMETYIRAIPKDSGPPSSDEEEASESDADDDDEDSE